ncbi:MAG: SagB/ThcOx family dehydrogenase [Thermodesulfobacteriota bacterium]
MIRWARQYHDRTSYDRASMAGGHLDWFNQPDVYKRYPTARVIPFPRDMLLPRWELKDLLGSQPTGEVPEPLDFPVLAGLLRLACAITARVRHSGGDFHYRSTPSAGALYPCELYLWASGVRGLAPGLYHYSLLQQGLVELRSAKQDPGSTGAHLILFITSIFFRSAWKYRERAYRYSLLDAGHLLENVLLGLRALGLPYRVTCDFQDQEVNRFLGLREELEACLVAVQVGGEPGPLRVPLDFPEPPPQAMEVAPRQEVVPFIHEAHRITCQSARSQSGHLDMAPQLGLHPREETVVGTLESWPPSLQYPDVLFARRSKRAYAERPMPRQGFTALLESLEMGNDVMDAVPPWACVAVGLLVGAVEGLDPGFYLLDRDFKMLYRLVRGDLRARMARVALEQGWMSRASIHVLLMSNLEALETRLGPRGYRYAMLAAGSLGQRIYLAGTALGMGACGVGAFYDHEAAGVLGLNGESRLLYLLTVGLVSGWRERC